MAVRRRVLYELSSRVGFPFSESEISPVLRKKIGELEALFHQANAQSSSLDAWRLQRTRYYNYFLVALVLGLLFVFLAVFELPQVIIGAAGLIAAVALNEERQKLDARIAQITPAIRNLESTINSRLSLMSPEIYNELSTLHDARSRPAQASAPPLTKETIVKEIVMVPCSYCRALMPQPSLFCPNCGGRKR